MALALSGSIGAGLVWGWLVAVLRRTGAVPWNAASVLCIVCASALLFLTIGLQAGRLAAVCAFAAAIVAFTIHKCRLSTLRRRYDA